MENKSFDPVAFVKWLKKQKISEKRGVMELIFGDGKKHQMRIETNMDVGYNTALDEILSYLSDHGVEVGE